MNSRIGGTIVTFLLSIPISAAGLVAAFGIPRFTELANSAGVVRTPPEFLNEPELRGQNEQNAPVFGDSEADPWGEFQEIRETAQQGLSQHAPGTGFGQQNSHVQSQSPPPLQSQHSWGHQDTSPSNSSLNTQYAMNDGRMQGDPRAQRFTESANQALTPTSGVESLDQKLTWREATLHLSEVGIEHYHLERGHTDGAFLFVCLFSPGDAPHITHRFEAEHPEPLTAVNLVLQQVDQWMAQRYSHNNYPNRLTNL